MAGAWQSEEFDNGRNFQPKKPTAQAPAAGDGVPPAMYNPSKGTSEGRSIGIVALSLRIAQILFTVIGFSVMASNSGEAIGYDYSLLWKATNIDSNAFLLSMDVIVCFYAIVQLVHGIVQVVKGNSILSSPTAGVSTITHIFDQVLAYTLMAACGAGAGTLVDTHKTAIEGVLACSNGFGIYCDKLAASVAMSIFAFLFLGTSAAMGYFRLYKAAR